MWKISERKTESYKILVMAVLLAGVCLLLCYFHVILRIGTVITHIFYIPIVLAAVWWKRKGLLVALFSSGFLTFSHVFLRPNVATANDYFRAFMFIATAFVVAELSRRITKKEEEKLRETRDYLEKLIDYANAPIIVWDPKFCITRFNNAFEHLTGYTSDEVIGQKVSILFPEESRDESLSNIKHTLSGEYWESVEIPILCKNGEVRLALWNSANIYAEDNTTVVATIAQGQDITERKKALEALRAANQQLRAANQQLRAGEQQLKATNQQLRANEQQLLSEITERKQAEEAIRKEKDKAQKYLDVAGVILMVIGEDRKVRLMNQKGYQILGCNEEDIVGKDWPDNFLPERVRREVKAIFKKLIAGKLEPVEYFENPILTKDGDERLIAWHNTPLKDGSGNIIGILSSGQDITEHKQAEEALRQSEERYRAVAEDMPVLVCRFLPDGEITYVNNAYCHYFEKTPDELVGSSFLSLIPEASQQAVMANVSALTVESPTQSHEHPVIGPDGKICWQRWTNRVLFDTQGKAVAYQSIGEDITEQREAEKRIKEHESQLKSLASELSLAEERERRRIAAGIHDDIAQKLAMAKFELQSLQASITNTDVSGSLKRQCQLMDQVVADARSLTFELSNPVLYQVGLEAAVESYLAERIQGQFGIKCKFKSEGPQSSLEEDVRVVLFQAVRELLANVVKHANASTVEVYISNTKDDLRIVVQDDGVGFDPTEIGPHPSGRGGFGLFNIRERLEYLGGNVKIESRRKNGARITMTVAIRMDAAAE